MGLAANQARLLTLTSRMADLEFTCQTLSNKKIRMAMDSNAITQKYSSDLEAAASLENQVTGLALGNESAINMLSWAGIQELNQKTNNHYELAVSGAVPVAAAQKPANWKKWEMPTTVEEFATLMNDMGAGSYYKGSGTSTGTLNMHKYLDDEGNVVESNNASGPFQWAQKFFESSQADIAYTSNNLNTPVKFDEAKLTKLIGWASGEIDDSINYGNDPQGIIEEAKMNAAKFQEYLLKGLIEIYNGTTKVDMASLGIKKVTESPREKAEDQAEREYDNALREMKIKETKLDLQVKNADTEYQACCTEYESAKGLIDKNVERGFSLFG